MSNLAVFYIVLIIFVSFAAAIVDRRDGIPKIWSYLDFCAGAAKATFVINFYYSFIGPSLFIPLVMVTACIDISSYVRDYKRVKKFGIGYVIFSYVVTTVIMAPAYIYAFHALP